jgi:hypothetical protein
MTKTSAKTMAHNEEDSDIKLARASAGLLADVELCLPKLLWKPSRTNAERGQVHSRVRRKDVDYIINLVCHCLPILIIVEGRTSSLHHL